MVERDDATEHEQESIVSVGIQLHGVNLEGRHNRRTRSAVHAKKPSDLTR